MRHPVDEELIDVSEYLKCVRAEIAAAVQTDKAWLPNAWEDLYQLMCEAGVLAAELGPYAAAEYACIADILVEYLHLRGSIPRCRLFMRRLSFDMSAAAAGMKNFDRLSKYMLSDDPEQRQLALLLNMCQFEQCELDLLAISFGKCLESYRAIENLCPDT